MISPVPSARQPSLRVLSSPSAANLRSATDAPVRLRWRVGQLTATVELDRSPDEVNGRHPPGESPSPSPLMIAQSTCSALLRRGKTAKAYNPALAAGTETPAVPRRRATRREHPPASRAMNRLRSRTSAAKRSSIGSGMLSLCSNCGESSRDGRSSTPESRCPMPLVAGCKGISRLTAESRLD